MFEATVTKFVKSVGEGSLVPVPDLDEADRCVPFAVCVKKNRRWFWQSPRFEPSPFLLHQLSTTPSEPWESDIEVKRHPLVVYNKTHNFSLSGKIGGSLYKLLEADVKGSDSVNVSAKFGQIDKLEVDIPALMNLLQRKSLDLKNEFVQQVHQNKRKVLCVIVGSAQLTQEGTVEVSTKQIESETVDASKVLPVAPNAEEEESLSNSSKRTFTLLKGTVLAYNVCELRVSREGGLELIVDKDTEGQFDTVDAETSDLSLRGTFSALLDRDDTNRQQLYSSLVALCAHPKDVRVLSTLVESSLPDGAMTVEKLQGNLSCDIKTWKAVLHLAGFSIKTDGAICGPKEETATLECVRLLFEALDELSDESMLLLRDCSNHTVAPPLIYLLSESVSGQPARKDDPKLVDLFGQPNPGLTFVGKIGYTFSGDQVVPPGGQMSELHGALRVVFVLSTLQESTANNMKTKAKRMKVGPQHGDHS